MKKFFKKIFDFISDGVWSTDLAAAPLGKRVGVNSLRFATVTGKGFLSHQCSLHAAGLTYFTLLSIVPILCLLMILAKTVGVGDFAREKVNARIDAMIAEVENAPIVEESPSSEPGMFDRFMSSIRTDDETALEAAEQKKKAARAFGAQAREISDALFQRIDEFNVDTLGWVGLCMLLWTVVSTLGMVEKSFNEIWEVPKGRPIWKQFSLYIFISIVLPLLIAGALSVPVLKMVVNIINMTMGQLEWTRDAGALLNALLTSRLTGFVIMYLFASSAFACFYIFMPYRRVSAKAAMKSGFVTSILFCGWLKLCAVAQVGIANSNALYGSFAFLPIVLAWVYVSWQIILLGSVMTYAFECVHLGSRSLPA